MVILIVIAAIVVLTGAFAWRTYNMLVPLRNACRESMSNVRVMERKREVIVSALTAQTDAFSQHEREILLQLSNDMRSPGGGININRLREAYPNLLMNSRISEQLQQLEQLETELQKIIAKYNGRSKELNDSIGRFPEILLASAMGFREEPFYST